MKCGPQHGPVYKLSYMECLLVGVGVCVMLGARDCIHNTWFWGPKYYSMSKGIYIGISGVPGMVYSLL